MSYMEAFGFVYVIWDGTAYKIGETATCPARRIKELQSGNPRRLTLLRVFECPNRREVEEYFHQELAYWRCDGGREWFRCTEEDIQDVAVNIEEFFGAYDIGPFKLAKPPKGRFTERVCDYWVNGDTLTLCMDRGSLNFTVDSEIEGSRKQGNDLILKLGDLMGMRRPTVEQVRRQLIFHFPYNHADQWMYVTYERKRSRWIDLNDFELISLEWKPNAYMQLVAA